MRHSVFLLPLLLICISCTTKNRKNEKFDITEKPNIIYILADDLGVGDLGCYGQSKIQTPNLDQMAKEGIIFTQHYSGSTVCAPSRCCLLTGKHTGNAYVRGNKEVQPEGQHPLADNEVTIAEILKKQGYATGAFGKWGLGMNNTEGSPLNQGFDQFFGYLCQRHAHRYYPAYLFDNNRRIPLDGNDWKNKQTYAPGLIHEKTLDFIKNNKDTSFFLYVPLVLPHAELIAPDDSLLKKYFGTFSETPFGKDNPRNIYDGNDYGSINFEIAGYAPQQYPHAVYAAMVNRIDLQVGQILKLLKELNIDKNTLVLFSSDNGPHQEGGGDPDFFDSNLNFRGYKRDLYEGGIRVPFLARWPGKIKPKQLSNHFSAFWDVLPSLYELTNSDTILTSDGISFLPTLLGTEGQKQHDYLYWEFHKMNGRLAINDGRFKLLIYDVNTPNPIEELYDLQNDPSETENCIEQYPGYYEKLKNELVKKHKKSDLFQFNFD